MTALFTIHHEFIFFFNANVSHTSSLPLAWIYSLGHFVHFGNFVRDVVGQVDLRLVIRTSRCHYDLASWGLRSSKRGFNELRVTWQIVYCFDCSILFCRGQARIRSNLATILG